MSAEWTAEDEAKAAFINQYLGPITVLSHEENSMTETAPENAWDDNDEQEAQGAGFPDLPDNPHNHVYTWSPKLPDGSMLVIRSQTANGLVEAVEAMAPLAGRLRAAWEGVVGQPQQAPMAPQGGFQTPQTPPPFGPNVSVPAAPGYVGPPVQQQAPQWGATQQSGFGGGAPQGNRQGPKPRPAWPQVYKINVPFQGKDAFKAFREQNKDALKGKVAWAGGGDYWIEGSVVQGFAQYNPVAA